MRQGPASTPPPSRNWGRTAAQLGGIYGNWAGCGLGDRAGAGSHRQPPEYAALAACHTQRGWKWLWFGAIFTDRMYETDRTEDTSYRLVVHQIEVLLRKGGGEE